MGEQLTDVEIAFLWSILDGADMKVAAREAEALSELKAKFRREIKERLERKNDAPAA